MKRGMLAVILCVQALCGCAEHFNAPLGMTQQEVNLIAYNCNNDTMAYAVFMPIFAKSNYDNCMRAHGLSGPYPGSP